MAGIRLNANQTRPVHFTFTVICWGRVEGKDGVKYAEDVHHSHGSGGKNTFCLFLSQDAECAEAFRTAPEIHSSASL